MNQIKPNISKLKKVIFQYTINYILINKTSKRYL